MCLSGRDEGLITCANGKEIIACANGACEYSWFHLGCLGFGFAEIPMRTKEEWYCPFCVADRPRKKREDFKKGLLSLKRESDYMERWMMV